MNRCRIVFLLAVPLACSVVGYVSGYVAPSSLQDKPKQEELTDYFRSWLEKDVVYIITDEERAVFTGLTTPEEKDQFIENFWRRRDTDRRTAFNEFKEEHYRRIAYANDHFASGVEGWYTDRGRIYIKFGPPTSIERNPTGGVYDRPMSEGGGTTMTYPRELWYYQYIEGVGSGIEIEFVDSTNTGRYEMAMRPEEKDALFYTTGSGNTLLENLGLESRAVRVRRSDAMRPLGFGDDLGDPAASPFKRLERLFDLERPPANQFEDLRTSVDTRVSYDQLPFQFRQDWFRISADRAMVNLTLKLDPHELSFESDGLSKGRATVNVYARVQTMTRQIVFEFDDVLTADMSPSQRTSGGVGQLLSQYFIPLEVGRYKLTVVLKEDGTGKLGTVEAMLPVPETKDDELATSSILLADQIGPAMTDDFPVPFVTAGGLKIYPNVGQVFTSGSPIGLYAEIYNAQLDQSTLRPSLEVFSEILDRQGKILGRENVTSIGTVFYGDRVSVARYWPSSNLPAGKYTFRLRVRDLVANHQIERDTELTVVTSQPGS